MARQFLLAVRGHRSQVAFARRLGYRGNPVAAWEAGRHFPTAGAAFRACERVGIDVMGALGRFGPRTTPRPASLEDAALGAWLDQLRGELPVAEVAARAGVSRFQVSRWLAGRTRPRLPAFFALLSAITARLQELLVQLVPVEALPALGGPERARLAMGRMAREEPWASAVWCLMVSPRYSGPAAPPDAAWIAARLGIDETTVARCVTGLAEAGAIVWNGDRWLARVTAADHGPDAATFAHWARVAAERAGEAGPGDTHSHLVLGVSQAARARLRDAQDRWFREAWAIATDPEPADCIGFLVLHQVWWIGADEPSGAAR